MNLWCACIFFQLDSVACRQQSWACIMTKCLHLKQMYCRTINSRWFITILPCYAYNIDMVLMNSACNHVEIQEGCCPRATTIHRVYARTPSHWPHGQGVVDTMVQDTLSSAIWLGSSGYHGQVLLQPRGGHTLHPDLTNMTVCGSDDVTQGAINKYHNQLDHTKPRNSQLIYRRRL